VAAGDDARLTNARTPIGAASACAENEIAKTQAGLWVCAADASGGLGGTPGGAETQVQFHDAGATFGGDAGLTYNKTTDVLTAVGGFVGALVGNASTATALAANPTDCGANQYATTIEASGNLTCAQVTYAQLASVPTTIVLEDQSNTYTTGDQSFASATSLTIPTGAGANPTSAGRLAYDSTSHTFEVGINGVNKTVAMTDSNITGNAATATALAANGANCAAGEAPLGVNASGAVEGCFDVASQAELESHTGAAADVHAASAITVTPFGDISALNVQAALEELVEDLPSLTSFIALTDTPSDYTGQTGKLIRVDAGETAMEFMDAPTLDYVCANGLDCAFTNLTETRPHRFAPNGLPGPQELTYHISGDFFRGFIDGTTGLPGLPPQQILHPGFTSCVAWPLLNDPTEVYPVDCITVENTGGVGTAIIRDDRGPFADLPTENNYANRLYTVTDCLTALCAAGGGTAYAIVMTKVWDGTAWVNANQPWHVPWNAAGALVDGSACQLQSQALLNGGPLVVTVICSDSASGTIEFNLDLPARYEGGALSICYEVNDTTSSSHVWEVSVQAMFRGSGSVVNNTWATAASDATVTMVTAQANYYACTSLTPNGAAAGVGRLFVKAVIDAAGGHTDASARVLGGYVTGN
jgi:hypothetical protein